MQSERQPDTRLVPQPGRHHADHLPPSHDARELTEGGARAEICLDGARYVLSITRQGKLILTK